MKSFVKIKRIFITPILETDYSNFSYYIYGTRFPKHIEDKHEDIETIQEELDDYAYRLNKGDVIYVQEIGKVAKIISKEVLCNGEVVFGIEENKIIKCENYDTIKSELINQLRLYDELKLNSIEENKESNLDTATHKLNIINSIINWFRRVFNKTSKG